MSSSIGGPGGVVEVVAHHGVSRWSLLGNGSPKVGRRLVALGGDLDSGPFLGLGDVAFARAIRSASRRVACAERRQ